MKPFIQVGNEFFKVVQSKEGLQLVQIKAEDAVAEEMERVVLSDVEEINVSLFQGIIDKARDELKTSLERNIKGTVLNALGFEKSSYGNGWNVDHCNGRMSAVTNIISEELKKRIFEIEIGKDFALTEDEKRQLHDSMKKDFKRAYQRKIEDMTWRYAEETAKKHVEEWVNELTKSKVETIAAAMLEKTLKASK